MMDELKTQFDFGQNWSDYSEAELDFHQFECALQSLEDLFGADSIKQKSFLDVGSGSGLFSIAAKKLGATKVLGTDINPKCTAVSNTNAKKLLKNGDLPEFMVISVLDEKAMDSLNTYDIVYAWGSLHHTGDMYKAIDIVLRRVKPGGKLCLAIYRKHITSPIWKLIKYLYNKSPQWLKKVWVAIFYPVIYIAKYLITLRNPKSMKRGMSFYYDVIDWIGGYPYEYATEKEILEFVTKRGFRHLRTIPAYLPTGNHQYLFEKLR